MNHYNDSEWNCGFLVTQPPTKTSQGTTASHSRLTHTLFLHTVRNQSFCWHTQNANITLHSVLGPTLHHEVARLSGITFNQTQRLQLCGSRPDDLQKKLRIWVTGQTLSVISSQWQLLCVLERCRKNLLHPGQTSPSGDRPRCCCCN